MDIAEELLARTYNRIVRENGEPGEYHYKFCVDYLPGRDLRIWKALTEPRPDFSWLSKFA